MAELVNYSMVLNPTKKNLLFNEQHITFKNRRDSSKNSGRQNSFNKVISQLNQNTKSKSRDTKHNIFINLQASLRFFHSRKLKFLGEARNINKSIQSLKNASLGVSNLSPKSNTPVKESEAIAQSDVPLKPMQLVITPLKKKSKISCTAMDIRPLMDKRFCEESRGVKEYVNKFKKNDDKFCKIRKKFKKLIVYKKKLNKDKDENLDYYYPTRNVSRLGSISKNSTNNPHDDCVQKQVNISQSGKNKISRNKSFKSSVKFSSLCKCALITKNFSKNSKIKKNKKIQILQLADSTKSDDKNSPFIKPLALRKSGNIFFRKSNSFIRKREKLTKKKDFHCKMVVNRIAAKEKGMLKQLESSEYTNDDFKQLNPILYKKWKSCIEDSQALRSQSHLYQYISGNYLTSFTSGLQYDLKIGKGQSKHEACVSLFSNNAKNTQKISLIPDPIMSRTISPCSTLKGGYELNEVSI